MGGIGGDHLVAVRHAALAVDAGSSATPTRYRYELTQRNFSHHAAVRRSDVERNGLARA